MNKLKGIVKDIRTTGSINIVEIDIKGKIFKAVFLEGLKDIEKGKLLTKVILDFEGEKIISIITTSLAERMNLKKDDKVIAFIKANEVALMEV